MELKGRREEIVAHTTTTDGAGGGTRRYFNVGELLNGSSSGFGVLLVVNYVGQVWNLERSP